MESNGRKYRMASIGALGAIQRTCLHDLLGLTGAEISLNRLPAGKATPFLHRHRMNEEVYVVLEGEGSFYADGEVILLSEGSALRVDPACARAIRASDEKGIAYLCVQSASGSLKGFTATDGQILEEKPPFCASAPS